MSKQIVFIDDSGDPGFKSHSSPYFVIACSLFMDDKVAERVADEIRKLRASKEWGNNAEFKFRTTRKAVIKELLTTVAKYEFRVSAVYIDKAELKGLMPVIDQSKLYCYTIKELLATLPLKEARIRIDGRSSKEYMKNTATYLRQELNKRYRKIFNVRFEDSVKNDLIQLADLVAGSINRSLQKEKSDSQEYIAIFKSKIDSIAKIKLG